MAEDLTIPRFTTEEEEVAWWDANRDLVEANLQDALKQGKTRVTYKVESSVEISDHDALRAQEIARSKGVTYQEYVRELFHEAIEREKAA